MSSERNEYFCGWVADEVGSGESRQRSKPLQELTMETSGGLRKLRSRECASEGLVLSEVAVKGTMMLHER